MSDVLVKRLHSVGCHEDAAELTRLRERNAELENTLKLHAGDCMSLSNEIDQMRRNAEDDAVALTNANTCIVSLEATVREMREAAMPFADIVEHDISIDEADQDVFRPMTQHNLVPLLRVGDMRRLARAAIASSERVVRNSEGEKDGN